MKTRDVLGLGCATIDELLFVEHYPAPDHKVQVQKHEIQGGGLTATALVAAARFGTKCTYGGMLGHEENSRRIAALLEAEGIDTDLIAWRDDAAAIHSTIIVDTTANTRNIFFRREGKVGAPPDSPSEAEIAASKVLLVDHYGGEGNTRAIQLARKHHVPVVADFERANVENWNDFFPLVSHLILSQKFAASITNETSPEKMAHALWNEYREVVVVTIGEKGCVCFDGIETRFYPSLPVEVVDTTGCGDVFHGVYAATLTLDWPLEKRIRAASIAAALKAEHKGAQKGIPTRDMIEYYLKN
jgi:sulfofructose kinase